MLKLTDIRYRYHEDTPEVLCGVSVSVQRGEFVGVLGHNGSGKSTLARMCNLTLLPHSGSVGIDDSVITFDNGVAYANGAKLGDSALDQMGFGLKQRVGLVFQNPDNQLIATVVEDDVAFAPENLCVPPDEIGERIRFALEAVGMYDFRYEAPHLLSGGQKQRIAIAGILAMLPDYIVLDEPTAMLDPQGRREVMQTLHKLNRERGMGILHITHNINELERADRIVVLNRGEVYLEGTPSVVLNEVELLRSIGLDVPQGLALLYELRSRGIRVPVATTYDDARAALMAVRDGTCR